MSEMGAPPSGGAPRFRLRPSIELFPVDDDVYLLSPTDAPALVVRQPSPEDRALLERLAADAVHAPATSETARRIEPLITAGVVIEVEDSASLPDVLAERFARQLPYFAETGDAAATQLRLRDSTVVVVGCGGLGSWALAGLACTGIGRFVLVDDDIVEISNLNRQIIYGTADIGRRKVECAARWVRALDPDVQVRAISRRVASVRDATALVAGANALVLTADWPPYKLGRWVNQACVAEGVPFVLAGQQPPLLKVGPTFVPGRGPCYACHERAIAASFPLYQPLTEHRLRHPGPQTTLGAASGVVGALLALEVMHLLVGHTPIATQGRSLLIDMHTLDQHWETFERDHTCPVCGPV